jgi:MGT family glycosyltransferase
MARIVVLSVPAYGHLNPVLPIVRELVRRGHEVTIFDEPPFERVAIATGAKFVPYPPAMSMEDMAAVLMGGDLMETFDLFLRATPTLHEFCYRTLRRNKPDVLVIDGIALWGEMVGRALGIPTVVTSPFFAYELDRNQAPGELGRNLRSLVRKIPAIAWNWIRIALKGVWLLPLHWPFLPARGDLRLMLTSRELHPPSPLFDRKGWAFVGAMIDPETRLDTFDASRLDGRPIIYVSLGTLIFGKTDFYERCMAALADYPAQVQLSAGKGSDLTRFANAPKNFVIAETFPQLEILKRTSIFITPAGLNSLHEALWFGVPMVAVPQHYEQLHNAEAMSARGAGITLDAEATGGIVSPAELRQAVETVAASRDTYARNALALGETLRAAGGFVAAADRIEQIARPRSGHVQPRGNKNTSAPVETALPDA